MIRGIADTVNFMLHSSNIDHSYVRELGAKLGRCGKHHNRQRLKL